MPSNKVDGLVYLIQSRVNFFQVKNKTEKKRRENEKG